MSRMRMNETRRTTSNWRRGRERERERGERLRGKKLKERREANAVQVSTEDWIVCIV